MNKLIKLISVSLIFFSTVYSQTVEIPSIGLKNINFSVRIYGIADSINQIKANVTDEDYNIDFILLNNGGAVDTSITVGSTGNFRISFPELGPDSYEIRILPGLLSILPPLLAILLALLFRQVVVSLILGIYTGAVFVYDYNPFAAILRIIDKYILNSVLDVGHLQVIIFTLLFGGMIGLISGSGGTKGIADAISKFAKNRKSTMISAWLSGLAIFFDDYANSLIVGNLMRPVTDKMKISREKLSFIVDATAAPVASIFIISSWIGFEVGLIQDGLNMISPGANGYATFIETLPYRFYPIAMLFFVFLIAVSQRDFSLMYKAERRAIKENKVSADDVKSNQFKAIYSELPSNVKDGKWYNGIIPILVIVLGTIIGLVYTGINSLQENGITEYGIKEIISNSDSYLAILWSSFAACIVAAILILSQRILNLSETIEAWFSGIRSMLMAVIILTLAWSIGSITVELKTADYIISLIGENVTPHWLPVLVFLVCGVTSFSTGTSWGTMAIMMPIVIPLAHTISEMNALNPADSSIIMHGVISSVLAGCVFGDHCSPISDTTILSSMASGCNHVDHVRTQLPYAMVVAIVCMLLGDIPTAFGLSPYVSIISIAVVLFGMVYLFGKRVESEY